jgi:addiction module HigA family antidote
MDKSLIDGIGPIHPGEVLREDIFPETGLTKKAFAERLGITRLALHNVFVGKSGVSTLLALKLARFLGTSPQIWLNLQQAYDLAIVGDMRRAEIEKVETLEVL